MALRSGDGSLPAGNDRCDECAPCGDTCSDPHEHCRARAAQAVAEDRQSQAAKRWTFTPCECTPGHPGGYFDASPETCSCRCHWRCPTCDMPDLDHPYWQQARPEDLARHRAESCHEKSDHSV